MTREEFPGLQVSVSVLCNFEVSPWKVFLLRKSYTSGWSWLCRLGSGDSWDQNWVSEWKREQEDSHFFARGWFPSSQMRDVNWLQVPLAQGWDKIQTIDSLLRKGGWRGQVLQFCVWKYRGSANWCILFSKAIRYFTSIVKVTPEVRSQIRLVRYQSELVSVTYQDYLQHCRQAYYIHGYSRSSTFLWGRNNCFQGHTSQVKVAGRALTRDQNCTGVSCDQRGVNIRYHFTWIVRCLLARCSIVQDFPLNTNPQFTALPQASFRYSQISLNFAPNITLPFIMKIYPGHALCPPHCHALPYPPNHHQ